MFSMGILYHLKALHGHASGREDWKVYHTSLSYEGNHAETESLIVLIQKSEYSPFPLD